MILFDQSSVATTFKIFESDVIRLYMWYIFHAPHRVGKMMPHLGHHGKYLHHERLLWQQIRWFINHFPSNRKYQKP